MSAEIYQFLPRANRKADRAFWKGPERVYDADKVWSGEQGQDTAPSEMNPYLAPESDPA